MLIKDVVDRRSLDDDCVKELEKQKELFNPDEPVLMDIQLCNCQAYEQQALSCHSYCDRKGWIVGRLWDEKRHDYQYVVVHDYEDTSGHG